MRLASHELTIDAPALTASLNRAMSDMVRYAAARLWVDAIIDPAETRDALIWALEAASLNPDVAEFKTGVIQT